MFSDSVDVFYKCTDYYQSGYKACVRWDSPPLAIDLPLPKMCHSLYLIKIASPPFCRGV
ncbi:hypothetical protein [Aeromonas veronii]|uniref:hypothetical protein n=1 Tax=Aeromonas veronii TaxID=654 RepID=UPI00307EA45D